jgi:hypothetical protein
MSFPHIYSANEEMFNDGIHKMRLPTGPSPSEFNPHLSPWDQRSYHDVGRLRDDERTIIDPKFRQMTGSLTSGGGAPPHATISQIGRPPFRDDLYQFRAEQAQIKFYGT